MIVGVIHVSLLTYGILVHGPGWDEMGHLPAGLSHWQTGRFDVYRVNPPLVRTVATAPLALQDFRIPWQWNPTYTIVRPEWDLAKSLAEAHGREFLTFLRIARIMCLPFSVLALWVVWKWSRELFGACGAVLSATVWAFSPLVLTNAQMITPDTAAAATGALACYAFRRWLNDGTGLAALLAGTALGIAELTKFTWLILFAVWPIQWGVTRILLRSDPTRPRSPIRESLQFLLIAVSGIFVINVGYGFDGSLRPLRAHTFYSTALGGTRAENSNTCVGGNRFRNSLLGDLPLPLPQEMLYGIDRQKLDFEWRVPSYLRGEWRAGGWWYYYIYGLLIKEPSAFVTLSLLTILAALQLRPTRAGLSEAVNLLLPPVALFAFVSLQTGFNHHLRYILPAAIFFAIAMGILGSKVAAGYSRLFIGASLLAGAGTAGSLAMFPHSHAYFNAFIGGPQNGPLHLLDSNVDWGQDLLLLERWAIAHTEFPLDGVAHSVPEELGVGALTSLTLNDVPKADTEPWPLSESVSSASNTLHGPRPGRYAVSVRRIYDPASGYAYFRDLTAVANVGYTIRIYDVTIDDANALRARLGYPLLEGGSGHIHQN